MNAEYIKELIDSGSKFNELDADIAMVQLAKNITTTYVLTGLQRQLTPDGFTQEIEVATRALYGELTTDPLYHTIRDTEIPYIFSEGMKGRLGSDKDVVITAKSLLRWIEGYLKHEDRRSAITKVITENYVEPTRQIATHRTYTDDDILARIRQAYVDYMDYLQRKTQPPKAGPQRIGECMEPYLIKDLGGRCMEYLVRNGYATEDEEFRTVLERMRKNNGELIKIS